MASGNNPRLLAASRIGYILSGLVACCTLSGCLIAGYSSSGEAFIWPGGLGLVVVLALLLWFFLRKR